MKILAITFVLGSLALIGCSQHTGRNFSSQSKQLATGNNQFAVELYGQLRTNDGNLFFSPFSISSCLAMTHAGARGNTEKQMAQVLHFGMADVQPSFGELTRGFKQAYNRKGIELNVANGLWLQKNSPTLPAFLDNAHKNYEAQVQQVDFRTEAESARANINAWIKEKTKGNIDGVVPAGELDAASKLVLVNAIYFKGVWKTKFDPKSTHDSDFYVGDNKTVQCPMMTTKGKFHYARIEESPLSCEVLELPYVGKDVSMVVLSPFERDGLTELESKLTEATLATLMKSVREISIHVSLPKFKLQTGFSLRETLSRMGMTDAFTASADFSGIDGTQSLFLSSVRHQAFVEVDEEGTTAAAATVAHVKTKSMSPSFRADHPFLFLIRDNRSGSILFMGRMVDPTK